MIKADQKALIQQTNSDVISIRTLEINYFSQFFSSFGTQSALIAGFLVNGVAQVPGLDSDCEPFWLYIYWTSTAIIFSMAMYVLLSCIYVSIFGQGLALRGPLGSMVRAVDGMILEQQATVAIFAAAMFFFAINVIAVYWIMMTPIGAITPTIITVIGVFFWRYYSLRIFNRFRYEAKTQWQENETEDLSDPNNPSNHKDEYYSNFVTSHGTEQTISPPKSKSAGLFNSVFSRKTSDKNTETLSEPILPSTNSSIFFYAGPLSILLPRTTVFHRNVGEKWERRYVVVRGSNMYFFRDKHSFEMHPDQPIRARPIKLEEYSLGVDSDQPPYRFSVFPSDPEDDRKAVEMSCDQASELATWVEVFSQACNPNSSAT